MPSTTGRKLPFACRDRTNITPDPKPKRQQIDVACKREGQRIAYEGLKMIRAANGRKAARGDIDRVVQEYSNTIYSKIVTYRNLCYQSQLEANGKLPFSNNDDYNDDDEESENNENINNEEDANVSEYDVNNNDTNNDDKILTIPKPTPAK